MKIEINIDDLSFKCAKDPVSNAIIEHQLGNKLSEIAKRHRSDMIREMDETISQCVVTLIREEYVAASKITITTADQ